MPLSQQEAKTIYGCVSPPWWDEVWIIARGPSAVGFDLTRMRGHQILMVNDFLIGTSSPKVAVCSADPDWARRHRSLLGAYEGEKFLAVALDTHPDLATIPGVTLLRRSHDQGLSEDTGVIHHGCNSGYAAINLAYHKRAKIIHLVGYDMAGKTASEREKFAAWAPMFDSMLPQLRARGARVINHNPASKIGAFEKEAI